MKRLYNVAILAAATALGCSGDAGQMMMMNPGTDGSPGGNPDLLSVGDGAQPGSSDLATMSGGYPAGPYGANIGDTFPLLTWQGYRDDLADAVATTKTYGTYSSDDIRLSGRKYAMIHTADFI
ncbi:MAG TPA: hypothetical protein VFF06_26980 [Polyangia bacterium]|nr:hypothetical protein [Polyangia bacterium]